MSFHWIEGSKEFPLGELFIQRETMPKYVHLAAHLNSDELEQRYRQTSDPVERSHTPIIWLLACGKCVRDVAEVTGYCTNWIRLLARRYTQLVNALPSEQVWPSTMSTDTHVLGQAAPH